MKSQDYRDIAILIILTVGFTMFFLWTLIEALFTRLIPWLELACAGSVLLFLMVGFLAVLQRMVNFGGGCVQWYHDILISKTKLRREEAKTKKEDARVWQEVNRAKRIGVQVIGDHLKVAQSRVDLQLSQTNLLTPIKQVLKPGENLVVGNIHQLKVIQGQEMVTVSRSKTPTTPTPPSDETGYATGTDWIKEFLFDQYGNLKVYHLKADGPTGVGKTHLLLHIIWLLQQPHPAAEYWLLDPKFEGESSGWPFEPFVTDFEDVAVGAEYLYENIVTARKHARRAGKPPEHPAFLLFDEADGCFDEHGEGFAKPVRRIIKEGRSGWAHCFVAGQSPLAKDGGFSGAVFRNTARLVMGNEAIAFINNAQFSYWEKDHRERLKRQLIYLQASEKRYVLAIPPSARGLPFVAEVPHLEKPNFVNLARPRDVRIVGQKPVPVNDAAVPGRVKRPGENGNGLPEKQFLQDLQTVLKRMHKLRYRGGKPVRASICEILGLPEGGREYHRAQAVAEYLENNAAEE